MCKKTEFLIWAEIHHPDEVINREALEEIIKSNPKMSFPKILKKVIKESAINPDNGEESNMQDEHIIADPLGMFEEALEELEKVPGMEEFVTVMRSDEAKKSIKIAGHAAAANLHATNCRVNGKAADKYAATLVQEAAIWGQRNPKTATVIGVGTVALAGYGAYKLITEYIL